MEIYVAGTPEEIAALVAATQERRYQDTRVLLDGEGVWKQDATCNRVVRKDNELGVRTMRDDGGEFKSWAALILSLLALIASVVKAAVELTAGKLY